MVKAVKQLVQHDPDKGRYGDCHRAAIAAILELPVEKVPHFCADDPGAEEFRRREREYLLTRGMVPVHVAFNPPLDDVAQWSRVAANDVCCILGGTSKTGVNHSVVFCNGEIVCDPSIKNAGIVGPCDDGMFWLTFLVSARSVI